MTGKLNPFREGDKRPPEYNLRSIEYTNYSEFAFLYSLPQKFQGCLDLSSMKPQGSICV